MTQNKNMDSRTAFNRWAASIPPEELKALRDKEEKIYTSMTKDQHSIIESIVCKRHHTRLHVDTLIDMGYDSSLTLGLACKVGHVKAVDILLAKGVFIPLTAINSAISSGNLVIIITILEAGCCRTPQMYGFSSPMETAIAVRANEYIIQALASYGIN